MWTHVPNYLGTHPVTPDGFRKRSVFVLDAQSSVKNENWISPYGEYVFINVFSNLQLGSLKTQAARSILADQLEALKGFQLICKTSSQLGLVTCQAVSSAKYERKHISIVEICFVARSDSLTITSSDFSRPSGQWTVRISDWNQPPLLTGAMVDLSMFFFCFAL